MDWRLVFTGVPILLLDLGDSRCRVQRRLHLILAEKGTGFALWRDVIDSHSKYAEVKPTFHTMQESASQKTIGFSFDNAFAATEFHIRFQEILADPENVMSQSEHGLGSKNRAKKSSNKSKSSNNLVFSSNHEPNPDANFSYNYGRQTSSNAQYNSNDTNNYNNSNSNYRNGSKTSSNSNVMSTSVVLRPNSEPGAAKDAPNRRSRLYRRHSFGGAGKRQYLKKANISTPCCFQHITSIRPSDVTKAEFSVQNGALNRAPGPRVPSRESAHRGPSRESIGSSYAHRRSGAYSSTNRESGSYAKENQGRLSFVEKRDTGCNFNIYGDMNGDLINPQSGSHLRTHWESGTGDSVRESKAPGSSLSTTGDSGCATTPVTGGSTVDSEGSTAGDPALPKAPQRAQSCVKIASA